MAKGGKIISDSFEINSETQVGFSVLGTCQSQDGGYIEVSLENLMTGNTIIVCKVDLSPNATTGSTGFVLRLKPENYKWTSKFTSYTAIQVSKPKQEGDIHIYDELHGEISYGQIGTMSPHVLTELNNSNIRTELQGIVIKPYDYYKMTFEIEFSNNNSVTQHFMKIISN